MDRRADCWIRYCVQQGEKLRLPALPPRRHDQPLTRSDPKAARSPTLALPGGQGHVDWRPRCAMIRPPSHPHPPPSNNRPTLRQEEGDELVGSARPFGQATRLTIASVQLCCQFSQFRNSIIDVAIGRDQTIGNNYIIL